MKAKGWVVAVMAIFSSVSATAQQSVTLNPHAPDYHTVESGDTLWDISARFLSEPWRWPEVWRLNQAQIRNPHLIYPGQVIMLDRSGPFLRLASSLDPSATANDKLSPQAYHEPLRPTGLSLPIATIKPFMHEPLLLDEATIADTGTIIALEAGRVFAGNGDTVFAKLPEHHKMWSAYRAGRQIPDPETGKPLGYEAQHLGLLETREQGTPTTMAVIEAKMEIGVGDKLFPSAPAALFSLVPRAPQDPVAARVASIGKGVGAGGRHDIVLINKGARDGIEPGHVLALWQERGAATYQEGHLTERFDLPPNRYGVLVVYRVFDSAAYGLVMDADLPVNIGDRVTNP